MTEVQSFQVDSPKPLNLKFSVTLHPADNQSAQLFDQQGQLYVTLDGNDYLPVQQTEIPDIYVLQDGQQIKAKLSLSSYLEIVIENKLLSTIYSAIYTEADMTPEAKMKFYELSDLFDRFKDKIDALWKQGQKDCGLTIEEHNDKFIIEYYEEYRPTPRKHCLVEFKITLKEKALTIEDKMTNVKDKLSDILHQLDELRNDKDQQNEYQVQMDKLAEKQNHILSLIDQQAQEFQKIQATNKQTISELSLKDQKIVEQAQQIIKLQEINEQYKDQVNQLIQQRMKQQILIMNGQHNPKQSQINQISFKQPQKLFHDSRQQNDQYQEQINNLVEKDNDLIHKIQQQAQELSKLKAENEQKAKMINEFNHKVEVLLLQLPKQLLQSENIEASQSIGPVTVPQLEQCNNIPAANGYFNISQPFDQSIAIKFIIENLEQESQISIGVCDANVPQENYLLEDTETYKFIIPDGLIQKGDLPPKLLVNHLFQLKDQITLKVTLDQNKGNLITIIVNNGQKHCF